jgi:WD40 repeat protein
MFLPASNENSAAVLVNALTPFLALAEAGLAVGLWHHPSKGEPTLALAILLTGGASSQDLPVFSHDGRLLAGREGSNTSVLGTVNARRILHRFKGHFGPINCLAFCPDGNPRASGGEDTRVILRTLATGKSQVVLRGHYGGHRRTRRNSINIDSTNCR